MYFSFSTVQKGAFNQPNPKTDLARSTKFLIFLRVFSLYQTMLGAGGSNKRHHSASRDAREENTTKTPANERCFFFSGFCLHRGQSIINCDHVCFLLLLVSLRFASGDTQHATTTTTYGQSDQRTQNTLYESIAASREESLLVLSLVDS